MKYIVPTMALFSLAIFGCTGSSDTTTTSGALESCFATSSGQMRCVATPGGVTKGARDVDGDGTADTFVCSNNEEGSHCDCAKLGCRDLRPRSEGAGGREGGACDGGRTFGGRDGGETFDRGGGGGRTGTFDRSGDGDMVCPPSATGAGGSGAAGTGAAGAPGAGGAPGSAGATGGTIG